MIVNIGILLGGLIVLIAGGEFLVRGSASIALRLKISPLVVGLTVVAFGTSAPELFISVQSALSGSPDIAMGNVIGSNICNLALVLGVTSFITPVPVQKDIMRIDWPMAMGSSLLMFALVQGNLISFWEGILFVSILASYTFFIIRKSRKETKSSQAQAEALDVPAQPTASVWRDILLLALGIVGLTFGSNWFVFGAKELAITIGVSERVVGITVVALGTSLPELATAIVAATRKETDIAMGNLIGSNIFNILSILGFTSIIAPIQVNDIIIRSDMIWMLLVTFMIFPMMITRRKINKVEGVILLAFYLYYIYSVIGPV
ncbi:calcium/sodium antiporter [Tunicatimonas pelagia]|uniref:calcium/sodium antiporter n=1 Tax=Tunicatimonas pelagia TaxID=931531 RepID=UPI0026655BA3|nr:calcium/sodium antiporter [Tunicatimonas pelagia]WKN44430.1 calcium/sodium antiporter [Tunicatimonas pelagia]